MILDVHSHLTTGRPPVLLGLEALMEKQARSGIDGGSRMVAIKKPEIDTADVALRYTEFSTAPVPAVLTVLSHSASAIWPAAMRCG